MILVNNPGSWSHIYWPLDHAEWHGWTPTDLVFPFFLVAVGVAITLALGRRVREGVPRSALFAKVLRRAALLFLIGLALNFMPAFDFHTLRIAGVLQRIAVVYLVAAALYLTMSPRNLWIIGALLLVGYWVAMTFVPVPGHGAGVLEPVGNLAQYIDQGLLAGHMWRPQWDPEGLLSTAPAIVTCLIGIYAGLVLQRPDSPAERTAVLAVNGFSALVAGWIWNGWFPINKNLWTSSYVMVSAGWSLLLLAVFYFVIDVQGAKRWAFPFVVIGTNAITIYVAQEIIKFDDISKFFLGGVASLMSAGAGAVVLAAGAIVLRWLFLRYLYANGTFLKV